jgi:hypothetical protein
VHPSCQTLERMNSSTAQRPEAEVLGLYSPRGDVERFEHFVRAHGDGCDPAHYSSETVEMFTRLGRGDDLSPLTEPERDDIEDLIRDSFGNAAYIEVLIRNSDSRFDPADFKQPDPSLREGLGQVAWNETYLSEDGETVAAGYPLPAIPEGPTLRVVFAIHYWKSELPLASSYGELTCPPMQPLPERLWRLVPYEMPD